MPIVFRQGGWGFDTERLNRERPIKAAERQYRRFIFLYNFFDDHYDELKLEAVRTDTDLLSTIDQNLIWLEKVIELSYQNEVKLNLFINPSYVFYREYLAVSGLEEGLLYWKQRVVEINERLAGQYGQAAFPVMDFFGYQAIMAEELPSKANQHRLNPWFQDLVHFSPDLGKIMMADLQASCSGGEDLTLGFCLNTQNLEHKKRLDKQSRNRFLSSQSESYQQFVKDAESKRQAKQKVRIQ
ncbi:hypothetical protein [Oceanicoccus sagamiensis]|uniref:Uncharacterized protein n=1 Tax=Oceanicoccus sagamiensis TaxID=716816 RepID=A0A1X9NHF4_9GAMM|nr:hypothetical protein [Oceanicoccus sagamiensis]ARN74939.1 hypothetical protein BST96_12940 [Oceanicoccus sagamiensis]